MFLSNKIEKQKKNRFSVMNVNVIDLIVEIVPAKWLRTNEEMKCSRLTNEHCQIYRDRSLNFIKLRNEISATQKNQSIESFFFFDKISFVWAKIPIDVLCF